MSSRPIPKTLKVGGRTYAVRFGPKSVPAGADGISYHPDDNGAFRVGVKWTTDTPGGLSTFLHEALHALSDVYGIGLSEKQVLALEGSLPGLVKDNPVILEALTR